MTTTDVVIRDPRSGNELVVQHPSDSYPSVLLVEPSDPLDRALVVHLDDEQVDDLIIALGGLPPHHVIEL